MSRWRRDVIRRVVAICLLSGAGIGVVHLAAPPRPASLAILVTAKDLASGTVLTEGDLTTRTVAADVGDLFLVEPGLAIGRRLAGPARRGEALTASRFVPRSVAEGLTSDLVALHVLVVDARSLDLAHAGSRVSLHDLDGALIVRAVLVLSIDPPDEEGLGLGAIGDPKSGLVVAMPRELVPQVLTRRGLDGSPPTVHLVLDSTPT